LKLNIKEKSIDVLKTGVTSTRNVLEYKYGWETLKQVVIPSKTLALIKEKQKDKENQLEEEFMLNVAIDVLNKGRIDFLMNEIDHVLTLYNFVYSLKN